MRLLWFIVGVGAGNTTRTLAMLDELRSLAPDLDIHFVAQGRAYDLLGRSRETHRLRDVTYTPGGSFSAWNIIRSNLLFPVRYIQNRRAAGALIRRLAPTMVIADSDFYCLGPARALGVPVVSVNNALVIRALLKKHGVPAGCGFSGHGVERADAWLQSRYAWRVICPVLRPAEGLPAKVVQIPPIVRPGAVPADEATDRIVVVTGGSGIGTHDLDLRALEGLPVETYGTALRLVPTGVVQHGFDLGAIEAMRRARVLVVQGGFSSVSEAMALRRPTVVVPITGQAEQHMNALEFEAMGLGLAARGADAGRRVLELLGRHGEFEQRCRMHPHATDGARHAARAILRFLEEKA